ncbi:MAG: hypothetical protein IJZ68_09555 [Bacteroidaceae bacterium]|nr:hypothetical protein [Bacteroidaceae bacterium]
MSENKKLMVWTDQYDAKWEEEYKEEHPDASDAEVAQAYEDEVAIRLDDERANLDIPIERDVLVIKTLGLWDGKKVRCSVIHRATIGALLERFFDGNSFYVESETGDLVGEAYHHDGTNYYRFREVSADAPNDNIDDLIFKLEDGEDCEQELQALTKSFGGRIAKVYGWEVNASDE